MFRYVVGFSWGGVGGRWWWMVCAVKGDLNCEYELREIYRVNEDLWREIIVNFVPHIFTVF